MKDLQIYRYIQYEQKQGRNPHNLMKLHEQAIAAKRTYRQAMRDVIELNQDHPTNRIKTAECWKYRARLLYIQIHKKIREEVCGA